ncbi:MAG: cytochrome c oxidase subunit II [Xanthobacteraceae bacterium]|jgi:cytochrome c oxidase subunit II
MLRLVIAGALVSTLSGCSGWQSALDPQGPQAKHLADLIWSFTAICTVIWGLVMIALAVALLRRRSERLDPLTTDPSSERTMLGVIGACVAATAVIVMALTVLSYFSQRALFAKSDPAVTMQVTGYQWWWDIRYQEPRPDHSVTTANEIHIPVGEPVLIKLQSADVIHSFWMPSLAGKMDLITGQDNELHFVADRPGIYRGQCAEFCGLQHAKMGMLVIASSREEYQAWRDAQLKPAETPNDAERQKGLDVFLSRPCVMCHTIRGTPAGSRVGPDLTHLASRRYIAAGTLPMSRGNLAAWIVDPHGIKPGVNMPLTKLAPDELEALAGYLAGLQ